MTNSNLPEVSAEALAVGDAVLHTNMELNGWLSIALERQKFGYPIRCRR